MIKDLLTPVVGRVNTKRVLFLDIDGVLNRTGTVETLVVLEPNEHTGRLEKHYYTSVDKAICHKYMDWLSTKKDLDVVLSSDWRKYPSFQDVLNEHGIFWIDTTGVLGRRGLEIYTWLVENKGYTHAAILDDNPMDMNPVNKYFVQTSQKHGLQDKHLRKIDLLLGYAQPEKLSQGEIHQLAVKELKSVA